MIIIPAVDIQNGKCVRLAQGDFDRVTIYSDSPVAMAVHWAQMGAQRIHIVDLDGSLAGRPRNMKMIIDIAREVDVPVQVGGGIRDMETIEYYLTQGVSSVILGTTALRHEQIVRDACEKFPERIMLGIDALNGKVAVQGWTQTTEQNAVELARRYEPYGIRAIVYTDIKRDGMGTGINLEATSMMARSVKIPIIASGGVASLEDINHLLAVTDCEIYGVIIGRALYTGAVLLDDAIKVAQNIK